MANGHKALAASKTKQWRKCAGSLAILEVHPELQKASGIYAQQGTCAHALIERCLSEGSEPEDYRGRIIKIVEQDDGGETAEIMKKGAKAPNNPTVVWFEVDTDMIDATTKMTDYVRARCAELDVDPKTLKLEKKVNPFPERDDTGGSADVQIDAWPDMLEVIDYKHGAGVFVPVEDNDQVQSYLTGAAEDSGWAHSRYRGTICQPRHRDGGIQWEEYTAEELRKFQADTRKDIVRVDEARALVKKGATLQDLYEKGYVSVGCDGSHCTFCELKARTASTGKVVVCPAVENKAKELMMVDFADDPEDESFPIPDDDKRLFEVAKWVPFMDKWAKEVKAQAERRLVQRLQAGEDGLGFKFIRGKSTRIWKNIKEAELVKKLAKAFNLKKEELYTDPELKSGPQIEKLLKGKAAKDKFNDEFLDKPPGKLTMVRENQKGEAIIPPSIGDDFDDDLEEEA